MVDLVHCEEKRKSTLFIKDTRVIFLSWLQPFCYFDLKAFTNSQLYLFTKECTNSPKETMSQTKRVCVKGHIVGFGVLTTMANIRLIVYMKECGVKKDLGLKK